MVLCCKNLKLCPRFYDGICCNYSNCCTFGVSVCEKIVQSEIIAGIKMSQLVIDDDCGMIWWMIW